MKLKPLILKAFFDKRKMNVTLMLIYIKGPTSPRVCFARSGDPLISSFFPKYEQGK